MNEDLEVKFQQLEKQVTDESDIADIQQWRERARNLFKLGDYLQQIETKALVTHLRGRIKSIRYKLSSTVGMEKGDNIECHARLQELASLLSLLAVDPQKELRSLSVEVERELENLSL